MNEGPVGRTFSEKNILKEMDERHFERTTMDGIFSKGLSNGWKDYQRYFDL